MQFRLVKKEFAWRKAHSWSSLEFAEDNQNLQQQFYNLRSNQECQFMIGTKVKRKKKELWR